MKKETTEEKKSGLGKLEKLDRWVTALTAIPVLGIFIKMLFEKLGAKGTEKLASKLEAILGFNTMSASTNVTDEIIYATALYSTEANLTPTERETINTFEIDLRGKDAGKATAFVLFVAQIVVQLKQEVKRYEKETDASREERSFNDFSKGFVLAGEFFKELLKRQKDEGKIAFLQGKNVFSLIPKKKEESPIVKKAKEFAKKKVVEMANGEKANQRDLNQTAQSFEKKARAFYEKSKGGK